MPPPLPLPSSFPAAPEVLLPQQVRKPDTNLLQSSNNNDPWPKAFSPELEQEQTLDIKQQNQESLSQHKQQPYEESQQQGQQSFPLYQHQQPFIQLPTIIASPSSTPSSSIIPPSLSTYPTVFQSSLEQYPISDPQQPSFPSPPVSDDEDITWFVILLLAIAIIITIATVIRSCGQKAGWLTGSSSSSQSSSQSSRHGGGSAGRGGRGGRGYGAHPIPNWEEDPEATEERLAALSDSERQAYDAAHAFQLVHPPNSIPTDISLSQYLSIQEKGVSAWEFEASYDHQLYVHDRTELSFFDQIACVQTNLPLPKQQEVYYWEVKMFEKSPNTIVSVGVTTKPYPTTRLPGWNRHSAGYFSHNGQKYCNSLWSGHTYGPIYFEGDVIGCGYRPRHGTIFFTRNGKRIEDAYTGFGRMNLFPTVGATGPCVLHVNFGQSGFVFVEANVKKWGLAPASGSLAPPPAYGSEMGSILLEAAGSDPNHHLGSIGGSSLVSRGRPILQSGSSRTRVHSAGASRFEDLSSRVATTNGVGTGEGVGSNSGAEIQNGDRTSASPVRISIGTMLPPPPNYSSLDRYGHPRYNDVTATEQGTDGHGYSHSPGDAEDDDASSITSTQSDESATFLLANAQREEVHHVESMNSFE
ncbi:Rsp5p-dependent ubiquitination, sorting of cargo proteins at the multivesicular body [Lobosporangium transversale]|uniref:Concanavalin A-like lectin/glucanase domain-containing protein n=1 Tax=Lobosporangium transversale TaxID=64571 RepID=A0A1Y2GY80_9FUNG|nr:concanavalin A-like lectin/glucanase domain-containing protein [Lobosporangium transversale]KAF9913711.1 Rsp5p-dependent ubiquitination, sorting of cargo proteins at the multivesicular body [Lobosporangium transversale]ORZ27268.1 concanavalin A-like lectin/glucanase domain-containing protein [Lobosporangium transversale]|eukprot:XP_021884995.1 concanavalin A-like lectin/glucanase domain-containing protein [Lobosporangium transversale]